MAAAASDSFIHLARPLAPNTVGIQTNLAPLTVNIQPQVRFAMTPLTLNFEYLGVLFCLFCFDITLSSRNVPLN